MEINLPSPFKEAFEHGDVIRYRCSGQDHEYVKGLGYQVRTAGDCSYYVKELSALSLSSYGNTGAFYSSLSNEISRIIFLNMVASGVVELYGFTAYIKENGVLRAYSYQDGVCTKLNDDGTWVECDMPYGLGNCKCKHLKK